MDTEVLDFPPASAEGPRTRTQRKAEALKRRHVDELARAKDKLDYQAAELKRKHAEEIERVRARVHPDQLERRLERLQKKHRDERGRLFSSHATELKELKKEHGRQKAAQTRSVKREREVIVGKWKFGQDLYGWMVQGDEACRARLMKDWRFRSALALKRRAADAADTMSPHISAWWAKRKTRYQQGQQATSGSFGHNVRHARNLTLGIVGVGLFFAVGVPTLWAASPVLAVAAAAGATAAVARYPISQIGMKSSDGIHRGGRAVGRTIGRVVAAQYDKQYRLRSDGIRQRYRVRVDEAAQRQR